MNCSPLLHLRTPHTLQDLDDSHGTALSASWTTRNGETHPNWALFARPRNSELLSAPRPYSPSFLCHPRLPINQSHVGGLDTYLGPAVGLLGVQHTTAQGQADGKRCNPTAESRRGAPRPDGPLPVTARRKQPHPIPAMASNASLDGARSTVPRYSAMAAWRTSPRRDAAIERELDRRSGGHDSAPARRRCRFGNRPRRSRPARGGPRRQRIPLSGGELTEAQTWRAGLQEPCRGGALGCFPSTKKKPSLHFAGSSPSQSTGNQLRASFAASQVVMTLNGLILPSGWRQSAECTKSGSSRWTPNSRVPRWIHDPGGGDETPWQASRNMLSRR